MMRGLCTIARRELGALLALPVGWVTAALFALLTGVVFASETLAPGQPATMRSFFSAGAWLLIPVAPAISMRLFAEEFRTGTIEPLRTAPVGDAPVVIGKFAGAAAFLVLMLLPTLALPITLFFVSEPAPDAGAILAGYLGLVLVGWFYLALGTLISTLTSSQTLAFLGTLVALVLLMLVSSVLLGRMPPALARIAAHGSVPVRMGDFARGMIDSTHVVFLLSAGGWLLTLATLSLGSRRWR